MRDVLGGVAGPGHVLLAGCERGAHRVDGADELAVRAELFEDGAAHPGHGAHGDRDVSGVGQLDAEGGQRGAQRAHAERDDVQGASAHRAAEEAVLAAEDLPHLGGVLPVVGGSGVHLALGADEGAVLDPGHIGGVGGRVVGVRPLHGVEFRERAPLDQFRAQPVVLGLGAVAPYDPVGLGEVRDLRHPGEQLAVTGGRGIRAVGGVGTG